MRSAAYLMPFALYGSGTRSARIRAAISPTACLSVPEHLDLLRCLERERDAGRRVDLDRVGEAERRACSFLPCEHGADSPCR